MCCWELQDLQRHNQFGRPRLGVVLAAIFVQFVVKTLPMQEEYEILQYTGMKYSEPLCPVHY